MWGNMCAVCFSSRGEGMGWGNGQLCVRQHDGDWRMVAGWRNSDTEAGKGVRRSATLEAPGGTGESEEDEPEEDSPQSDTEFRLAGLFPERTQPGKIEIYRRGEMIEASFQDWQMAVLIFREMGWKPARDLAAHSHPLTFVPQFEGEAMQHAGRSLFALLEKEPAVSTSVHLDLGLFYRLTEFVGNGAFIVARPGRIRHSNRRGFRAKAVTKQVADANYFSVREQMEAPGTADMRWRRALSVSFREK
jgi:hypothetical protein